MHVMRKRRPDKQPPKRRVSYVVWLNNRTSRKDDEWIVVKARNPDEAIEQAKGKYDSHRFSIGHVIRGTEKQVLGI